MKTLLLETAFLRTSTFTGDTKGSEKGKQLTERKRGLKSGAGEEDEVILLPKKKYIEHRNILHCQCH